MSQIQITSVPVVMIIVCAVLGINVLSGVIRGFVRKISGIIAFFLAVILVTAFLPAVTSWLRTTPVYDFIRQQCENVGTNLVRNTVSGALGGSGAADSGSGTFSGLENGTDVSAVIDSVRSDDGSGTLDRGKIKAQLQAMGYDPSMIDSMSDAELESYAQQLAGAWAGMIGPPFLLQIGMARLYSVPAGSSLLTDAGADRPENSGPDVLPVLFYSPALLADSGAEVTVDGGTLSREGSGLLSQLTAGMDRVDQTKFIESLPLPQSIKDQMEAFNNENGYLKLGANDFGSYIISYIASLIMNVLAYAVTLLAVWLIIRLILGALSVFRSLPIVGTADRLLGLLLGLIQGILIVWGLFLVLSMFSTTSVGAQLMREIYASGFLRMLYNANPFLNSAAGAIRGIM